MHLNAAEPAREGELDVKFLKKYIQYCRANCGPRLSESATEKLKNHFVQVGLRGVLQDTSSRDMAYLTTDVKQRREMLEQSDN